MDWILMLQELQQKHGRHNRVKLNTGIDVDEFHLDHFRNRLFCLFLSFFLFLSYQV